MWGDKILSVKMAIGLVESHSRYFEFDENQQRQGAGVLQKITNLLENDF